MQHQVVLCAQIAAIDYLHYARVCARQSRGIGEIIPSLRRTSRVQDVKANDMTLTMTLRKPINRLSGQQELLLGNDRPNQPIIRVWSDLMLRGIRILGGSGSLGRSLTPGVFMNGMSVLWAGLIKLLTMLALLMLFEGPNPKPVKVRRRGTTSSQLQVSFQPCMTWSAYLLVAAATDLSPVTHAHLLISLSLPTCPL
jgi:hypothetical protein